MVAPIHRYFCVLLCTPNLNPCEAGNVVQQPLLLPTILRKAARNTMARLLIGYFLWNIVCTTFWSFKLRNGMSKSQAAGSLGM